VTYRSRELVAEQETGTPKMVFHAAGNNLRFTPLADLDAGMDVDIAGRAKSLQVRATVQTNDRWFLTNSNTEQAVQYTSGGLSTAASTMHAKALREQAEALRKGLRDTLNPRSVSFLSDCAEIWMVDMVLICHAGLFKSKPQPNVKGCMWG